VKVKIIRGKNIEDLVNNFIKDKVVVDIKYSTPFGINGSNNYYGFDFDIYDSVLIMYKEQVVPNWEWEMGLLRKVNKDGNY
jgi:hypothetical protein